jgi:hypothetical protein
MITSYKAISLVGLSCLLACTATQSALAASAESGQIPRPTMSREVPEPVAGAPLSKEYVASVGRMAYLWGWPLVNMANRLKIFSMAPHKGLLDGVLPVAPANQLAMLSDYVSPNQRFVTSPNQDVVYGAGFFALDQDAVVIQVPDFGKRYWIYQVVNQRSDSFARFGSQYGTQPGRYLLVGPDWQGETPAGFKAVYRSSTNINAIFPRVFLDDTAEDRVAVQPLINQIMAYPLKDDSGALQTTEWNKLPTIPNPNKSNSAETRWVAPEKFFAQLPSVMAQVPPLPGEEALYAWIGSVLQAAQKDPALMQTLIDTAQQTEAEVIAPMFEFRNNGVDAGNGWRTQKNSARFGTDYFQRTATAKGNMFSNMPEETLYFGADFDSQGQRLSGDKAYSVTFAKGQTPPVNGFWSLTLYNEQHFFVPNELNRFSLGTKNKNLKYNPDGSLTFYVQAQSPGSSKEANWLPSAAGPISLYIRAYSPKAEVVKGKWVAPVIEQVAP